MVECPICAKPVKSVNINQHIDSNCQAFIEAHPSEPVQEDGVSSVSSFFQRPAANRVAPNTAAASASTSRSPARKPVDESAVRNKRTVESIIPSHVSDSNPVDAIGEGLAVKRQKPSNPFEKELPLAVRMRPRILDDICGQELVGPKGVLRELILQDRIPSMILWGGPGTGKTTIARVIASMVKSRFIEINSTNFGVAECKKFFFEVRISFMFMSRIFHRQTLTVLQARSEQKLTGRKTIIFCDEIHRFSKSQQEVFCKNLLASSLLFIY